MNNCMSIGNITQNRGFISPSNPAGNGQRSSNGWEFHPPTWHWELLNGWWPLTAPPESKNRAGSTLSWRAVGARCLFTPRLRERPALQTAFRGPHAGSHTQTQVKQKCLDFGNKYNTLTLALSQQEWLKLCYKQAEIICVLICTVKIYICSLCTFVSQTTGW